MTFYRLDPPTVRNVGLPAIRQEMYTPLVISREKNLSLSSLAPRGPL